MPLANRLAATIVCSLPFAAPAAEYRVTVEPVQLEAVPVEIAVPLFDGKGVPPGQEGWVRLSLVVDTDGRSRETAVLDSAGGVAFERAARSAAARWRFAPGEPSAGNIVDLRFVDGDRADSASRSFMLRFRAAVRTFNDGDLDGAERLAGEARALGGWNLYETTMLCLLSGRIAGARGDAAGQLAYYRRALGIGNDAALPEDSRDELEHSIAELETELADAGKEPAQGETGSADDG